MNKTILIIGTIFILILVGGYMIKRLAENKRKLKKAKAEDIASKEKSEQEVDQEIEYIKSDLLKSGVCYYIDVHYRKYGISNEDLKKIQEQYPQVLAKPFIDWTAIDASGDKSYILEEKLRAILNANKSRSFNRLKSNFADSILNDAEKEAEEVLKSVEMLSSAKSSDLSIKKNK